MSFDPVSIGSLMTSFVIVIVAVGYILRRVFKLSCCGFTCEQNVSNTNSDLNPISSLSNILAASNELKQGIIPQSNRVKPIDQINMNMQNLKSEPIINKDLNIDLNKDLKAENADMV